ncbi:MAG: tetratricopeptide repeat protein [Pyrinomonadaceae bacterium]
MKCAVLTVISILICGAFSFAQNKPDPEILTARQWREDLNYLAEQMPKSHKNAFHSITKEEFEAAVKRLDERIPSLKRNEIIVELSGLAAMIGDGHTEIWLGQDEVGFHQYPLRVYLFEDGLYLQAVEARYAGLAGAKVVKIGKLSAEEAFDKVSRILARDNEMFLKAYTPRYLIVPEVLSALRIIDDPENGQYVVRDKSGKLTTLGFSPGKTNDDLNAWSIEAPPGTFSDNFVNARKLDKNTPLYLKNPQDIFWYQYLPEPKTLYVKINAIRNKPDETMEDFAKRVFQAVDQNDVEKFVLDLRQNGGGNNQLNEPWMLGIVKRDKINQFGKFFVIIDRHTFSAASHLVTLLERHTKAVFVGEPTGASPNHYGDAARFSLPNSHIRVDSSALYWQNSLPWDARLWTPPQIYTPLTFTDYINNRDPAMEAILDYRPGGSFPEVVSEFVENRDLAQFVRKYKSFKSDPSHIYVETENEMNRLGYRLMGSNRLDDAIEIFKLNVETYPQSANAYDSLAEAYMNKGNRESAIRFYRRSLELNPGNTNAAEKIKMLKEKN